MSFSLLFVSPHLDDVAFSCGGVVAACAQLGHRTTVCTVFTGSVASPQGFALACQLDKGLHESIDYMELRRAEDRDFADIAQVSELIYLPFFEAPHRGYNSAAELFQGIRGGDQIGYTIAEELRPLARSHDFIFAPQGIGRHVDHLQTRLAIEEAGLADRTLWYRDMPYAMRSDSHEHTHLYCNIDSILHHKTEGCCAYRSQLPFQFGGPDELRTSLKDFHRSEARSGNCSFEYAECFNASSSVAEEFAAALVKTCLHPNLVPSF